MEQQVYIQGGYGGYGAKPPLITPFPLSYQWFSWDLLFQSGADPTGKKKIKTTPPPGKNYMKKNKKLVAHSSNGV